MKHFVLFKNNVIIYIELESLSQCVVTLDLICRCVSGDFLILHKVIIRFMMCAPAHFFLTSVRMLLNQTHSKSVGIQPHPHFSIYFSVSVYLPGGDVDRAVMMSCS